MSAVGFLLLAGLYISSLSACLGCLYGTPRVLQTIASENVIPFMRFLGWGVSISTLGNLLNELAREECEIDNSIGLLI